MNRSAHTSYPDRHEEALLRLGYTAESVRKLLLRNPGKLRRSSDVAAVIGSFGYAQGNDAALPDRSLVQAILSERLTCLEAALIGHDLMGPVSRLRKIIVMTRYNPKDESYLGHTVMVFKSEGGLFGAISLSRYPTQGNRQAVFSTEEDIVLSFAKAYVELGLTPVCYGILSLSKAGRKLDWRKDSKHLEVLHDWLVAGQDRGFEIQYG